MSVAILVAHAGVCNASMRSRATIALDRKKLASVQRTLGTRGISDTIERALDEVLAIEIRKRHLERPIKQQGIDLANEDVVSRAWR